jgi:hypothetical protein
MQNKGLILFCRLINLIGGIEKLTNFEIIIQAINEKTKNMTPKEKAKFLRFLGDSIDMILSNQIKQEELENEPVKKDF